VDQRPAQMPPGIHPHVSLAAVDFSCGRHSLTHLHPSAVFGLSKFGKGAGGLPSSARSDAGETARTIGALLNWMTEQQDVFVVATANDVL
jgi:hypothetical protein